MEEEKALDLASIFAEASGLGQQSRAGIAKGAVSKLAWRQRWPGRTAASGESHPLGRPSLAVADVLEWEHAGALSHQTFKREKGRRLR